MAEVTVSVQPVVGSVTLTLSLDEALYVAGVLAQSSQFHSSMQEWFDAKEVNADRSVWDTLVDQLEVDGIDRNASGLYHAAMDLVSFTPPARP